MSFASLMLDEPPEPPEPLPPLLSSFLLQDAKENIVAATKSSMVIFLMFLYITILFIVNYIYYLVVFLFDNDINIHLKDNAIHVRYIGKRIITLVVIAN